MTISVISVSNLLNKFMTSTLSLAAVCQASVALASTPLTADLWAPLGVTAILLGGGRGHVTDFSAADNNPAGIALQKTYTVSGELGWSGQKARQAEAAACDSATSELAACIKFRQTQSITGAKDRRYTVGFAESLQQMGGMILGVGGDYVQFAKERSSGAISAPSTSIGQRLRVGLLYPLSEGVFIGANSDGLYDSTGTEAAHGAGLSVVSGKYFLFNGDLNFGPEQLKNAVFGVTVFPRDFLDLAVSYGYDPRESRHKTAAGVVVKSQQARLLYSVVRSDSVSSKWVQRVGIGIFMAGDTGSR
jgi:hypothetical protein